MTIDSSPPRGPTLLPIKLLFERGDKILSHFLTTGLLHFLYNTSDCFHSLHNRGKIFRVSATPKLVQNVIYTALIEKGSFRSTLCVMFPCNSVL